jgi:hypothetical protein
MRAIRDVLKDWVEEWSRGEIDEAELRDRAEEAVVTWDLPDRWPIPSAHSSGDLTPESATFDVLSKLASLHVEWITREDAGAILDVLRAEESETHAAWSRWLRYWNGIDWQDRERRLASNPFYAVDRRSRRT